MDRGKIGKIQIWIGCILLLITIISSVTIIKNIYLDNLIHNVQIIRSSWKDVSEKTNGTSIGVAGHVIGDVIIEATIVKTTGFIFIANILILIVLSIILIMQGLININEK